MSVRSRILGSGILSSRAIIGKAARLRGRRGVLAVAVLAACGVLIPAAAVPAHASSPELKVFWRADRTLAWHEEVVSGLCLQNPAMTRNSNNTGTLITCEGPGNSLWFWWQADGSTAWNQSEVAGYGSAYSDPAITVNAAGTEIAAEGPGNSLWFWWNLNGSPAWYGEQVAGPGSTYSAPAITDSGSAVQIAAAGPGGTLWFYWVRYGSSSWNSYQVGGPGAVAGSTAPAMTLGPLGNAEIAVIHEYSPLWLYRQGLFGWTAEQVSGSTVVEFKPWITRSATGTEITANVAGYIYLYANADGSQTWTPVYPSNYRAYYGMPITRTAGGSEIAANAYDGSLDLYGNADGSPAWSTTHVAGPGTVSAAPFTSWPAIVRYPSHHVGQFGGTLIAVVGPPGS